MNTLTIHQRINYRTWFNPVEDDKWFMWSSRAIRPSAQDDIYKADNPFIPSIHAPLSRGLPKTIQFNLKR